MRMDAKKYAVSNYLYQMVRIVVGFTPFSLFFGYYLCDVPLWLALLLPIFVMAIKTAYIWIGFLRYEKNGEPISENSLGKVGWGAVAVFM